MNIILSFQPQQLPPPFAYAAVMNITIQKNQTSMALELTYLDRESVSPDELRAEGFTENDDFNWEGEISSSWNLDLKLLAQSAFNADPNNEIYLHVEVDNIKKGFPVEISKAEMLFQELMQAVLEKSQIEAPLHLQCSINHEMYSFEWSFANRSITANDNILKDQWEKGRELMKLIFSLDFETMDADKKAGKYAVNPGDGCWYSLTNDRYINQLKSQIEQMVSDG